MTLLNRYSKSDQPDKEINMREPIALVTKFKRMNTAGEKWLQAYKHSLQPKISFYQPLTKRLYL